MTYMIIKSDERKAHERQVMKYYGIRPDDSAGKEAAACIAAKSQEAYNHLKKMENKYK